MPQYRQNVPSYDVAEDWLLASTPWYDDTGAALFILPLIAVPTQASPGINSGLC